MFASAKHKIDRANHHIEDLERQIADFVASKPHRFGVQADPKTGQLAVHVRFVRDPPASFALVIGDAVHNLRTALDHMMWELVNRDNGTNDRYLKFPTGDNRVSFVAFCNGIKTPSQWVKDAIRATEAFCGGAGHDLYHINDMDNVDKHFFVTPILRATSHPPFTILNPNGSVMARMEGNVFISGFEGMVPVGRFPAGCSIELDDDAECPPSIFINQPGDQSAFIASPVLALLRQFRISVTKTIGTIEQNMPR